MGEEEKLIFLKSLVGGNDTDETLSVYLKVAGRKIIARAYPYDNTVTDVPAEYDTLQCEIAAYLLNKRGAEGQTSHSENGISRSYENADVPASMMNIITPHCGVFGSAADGETDSKPDSEAGGDTGGEIGGETGGGEICDA